MSNEILRINRENMEQARDKARATARSALIAFGVSLAVVSLLLVGVGWYLLRTILGPIQAVTEAAHAIGTSGQLDRTVPVFGRDELGRLAVAFNAMTRELRKYRRSNLDRMMRAQKTAQATIDSFPDPVLVVDPGGRVDLANPAARALFGVGADRRRANPALVWQPPDALRQPLADALQLQRAYQPEQFDQAVSFQFGGEDRTYLPAGSADPRPGGQHARRGGGAQRRDPVPTARPVQERPRGDRQPRAEDAADLRPAGRPCPAGRGGRPAHSEADRTADRRPRQRRAAAGADRAVARPRPAPASRSNGRCQPEDPAELLRRAADGVRPRAEDKHIELQVVAGEPLAAGRGRSGADRAGAEQSAEQRGHLHSDRRQGHAFRLGE